MSDKVEALKEFLAMATKKEELASAIDKSAAELTASHPQAQTANLGALPAPHQILARS